MRLPTNVRTRFLALGLTTLLAACGRFGGDDTARFHSTGAEQLNYGPAADYPVVLGDPYSVNGTLYTPVDTLNYDEVGYAVSDPTGVNGVTVSHRTLPMPSYVEITALNSGRTVLARVERRGPLTGNGVVGLSKGAKAQLEIADDAPVRIRRVNPPEMERAKLRAGEFAPLRMETPTSLLTVLKRKLSDKPSVSLASRQSVPAKVAAAAKTSERVAGPTKELPPVSTARAPIAPAKVAAPGPAAKPVVHANTSRSTDFEKAFANERKSVTKYPLAPLANVGKVEATSVTAGAPLKKVTTVAKASVKPKDSAFQKDVTASLDGSFVIQAAAFSSKANADKMANSIQGFVEKSGKFYRVRKGPFVSRGQAEAALAKVRAAGYKDARVYKAG